MNDTEGISAINVELLRGVRVEKERREKRGEKEIEREKVERDDRRGKERSLD